MSRIGSSFRADFHMVPPFVDENSPTFHVEEVYRYREICGKQARVFDLLQVSGKPLGYQFEEPARDRIGHASAESIRRFWRKIQSTAELRLGLNCPLNQRRSISINQSFS